MDDRERSRRGSPGDSASEGLGTAGDELTAATEALVPGEEAVAPLRPLPSGRPARGLTADGRLRSGRLAGLTMWGAMVALAWPVLVDSLLNSLVGLTDTVLAAGISEAATDAIGAASYILWFVGLVLIALDVGATALISRAVGAGRLAVANAGVAQALVMALVAGSLVATLVAAAMWPMATLLRFQAEARSAFIVYLGIVTLDVPFMAILFMSLACLRACGDTFRPMRVMAVVNVVNIVASWVLSGVDVRTTTVVAGEPTVRTLVHNPFPFDLGVAGIALGTMLGHAVGAGLVVRTLIRGSSGVRLYRRRLRPHPHTLWRIVRVGLPNFLETLGMWAGNFLVVLMVGWLGAGQVGAHVVAIRIEAFSFQPGLAMGIAAATLAGQYLGAGSARLARRAVAWCTALAAAIMGTIGLAFVFIPQTIVGLFSAQPTHLSVTPRCLFITGLVQVPFAMAIVLRSGLRGAGDVRAVMWLTWMTTYGVRLPLAYALSGVDIPLPATLGGGVSRNPFPFEPSLPGLWAGLCIEIVIRAAAFTWRFLGEGWLRHRV